MADAPPTILVAEDELASLEVLVLLLEAEGYRVLAVDDGEQALSRLRSEHVDVVVTDYMMPKLDGLALCAAMRDDPQLSRIPVILMTASIRMVPPPGPPIVAWMEKPLLFDKLVARIREQLAHGG